VTLPQALDFAQEVEVLSALLDTWPAENWARATLFKHWSANDIVRHLHFWNEAADWSVRDPQALHVRLAQFRASAARGESMRVLEGEMVQASGAELLTLWRDFALDMAQRWQTLDPRQRVEWAGPSMSVRSSITARQMETWAHGQALFDLCGQDRPESARLLNIVVLGVNTFGWSHSVRGHAVPAQMPRIELTGPAGEAWHFGEPSDASRVEGSALGFAQVVTQTRHVQDTNLQVRGDVAAHWMAHAQCFAGRAQTPPAPGVRQKAQMA
jgi:uncharacterized protein (TIGR03084 family)